MTRLSAFQWAGTQGTAHIFSCSFASESLTNADDQATQLYHWRHSVCKVCPATSCLYPRRASTWPSLCPHIHWGHGNRITGLGCCATWGLTNPQQSAYIALNDRVICFTELYQGKVQTNHCKLLGNVSSFATSLIITVLGLRHKKLKRKWNLKPIVGPGGSRWVHTNLWLGLTKPWWTYMGWRSSLHIQNIDIFPCWHVAMRRINEESRTHLKCVWPF